MARYKFANKTMQAMYDDFVRDPDRIDVSGELALARLMLQAFLIRFKGDITQVPLEYMDMACRLADNCASLAERLMKIERTIAISLSVSHAHQFTDTLCKIIATHVKDPREAEKIIHEIQSIQYQVKELEYDAGLVDAALDEELKAGAADGDSKLRGDEEPGNADSAIG